MSKRRGAGPRSAERNSTRRATGRSRSGGGDVSSAADAQPAEVDTEEAARSVAFRQLAAQPRSRAELARAMARRGISPPTAERVLDRLEELQLIDDQAFAQAWVESRHAGRGLARRALAYELRQRGVDESEIDTALDQLDDETEEATARALVDRKLRGTRGLPAPTRIRRLVAMLARKGYSGSIAQRVVREALAAEELSAADDAAGADADAYSADDLTAMVDGLLANDENP